MTLRKLFAFMILLFVTSTAPVAGQAPSTAEMEHIMEDLQASHIRANVPPDSSFMTLLERDVRAYLVAQRLPSKSVEIELLRKGPTQSGVSYPKYYLWIRAAEESGPYVEGAMRVAAIERVRFDITDFTSAASIRSDPASLASIYPALLAPAIRRHAGAD